MNLEIRRLESGDMALLDRVADNVFDEQVRPDRLAAYLAESGHLIVAMVDGEVVGHCAAVVHRHPDKVTELYIDEVGVAPAFQRQGIARRMLEEMFALGKALGCEEAWVGTEPDNVAGLYERLEVRRGPAEDFVMYVYYLWGTRRFLIYAPDLILERICFSSRPVEWQGAFHVLLSNVRITSKFAFTVTCVPSGASLTNTFKLAGRLNSTAKSCPQSAIEVSARARSACMTPLSFSIVLI